MKNSRQRNILAYNFFSTLCWSVIVASPLVARAADNKPITSKDWTYSKRAVGSEILCFAETQKKVGDLTWTFSVVADPSKATATAIYVGSGAGDIGSKLDLQTDSSRTLYTHLRSSSDDVRIASTAYWFAPNKLSSFYQQLRRDSTIKLAYIDAEAKEQKLYFSLSGSMAALDNLETLCDSKKEVVWLAFFDGLDRQVAAQGTGLRGVDNLKTTLNDAWATYFVTGVHQSAANALDGQMRPYIEQEKAFLARSGKLNGQLGVKNAEKSQVESKKAAFVSTRARLAEELDRTEQSLSGALATLKTKEDIYRPAAEEVKPAIEAFNAASAEVNNYAARISEQENRVDSATSRISQLDRESRQKQSDIDAYERELNDLQTRRARAQSDLNSFNYDWELRRAMDSDSRYRWTFEEIRRNQSNIDQLSRDYHRAEEDNRDAERDLRQCQGGRLGVASLAMENAVMARGPGGGGSEGPRPGGGGNGPHPGNGGDNGGGGHGPHPPGGGGGNGGGGNTPPPRPNCSSQEARARQTRDDLNTISSRLSNEQQSLDQNRYALDRRRQEIESDVNQRYSAFQRAVSDLDASISNDQSQIRSLESDISDISRNQIPRQRDVILDARSELNSLRPLLQNAQQRQADKRTDMNTVIARTQYEVKKAEYMSAYQTVEDIRTTTSSLDAQIKSTDAQITLQNRALTKVQTEIDALVASLAKETSGLDAIEAILQPLRQQKAAHAEALAEAQALLLNQLTSYKAIYRDTLNVTAPVMAPAAFYDWQQM